MENLYRHKLELFEDIIELKMERLLEEYLDLDDCYDYDYDEDYDDVNI